MLAPQSLALCTQEKIILALFIFLLISFLSAFVGFILARFAINEETFKSSGYLSKACIYHIPEIFLKSWYKPQMLYVRNMIIWGLLGCIIGFTALYVLARYNVV